MHCSSSQTQNALYLKVPTIGQPQLNRVIDASLRAQQLIQDELTDMDGYSSSVPLP